MSEKDQTFENVLKENRVLVSIETVKIKDFIFSTNKLKLIRGASYLLDYMNQVEVPRILKKYGLEYKTHELVDKIYNISDDKEFLEKVDEEVAILAKNHHNQGYSEEMSIFQKCDDES